jgi:class 3 adenylate cyclase
LLRAYQNAVAGEVARFDGYVARFMGDGILAYFGVPLEFLGRSYPHCQFEFARSTRAGARAMGFYSWIDLAQPLRDHRL